MLRFLKAFFVKSTPPETAPQPVVPYKVEALVVVEVAPTLAPIVEEKPVKKPRARKTPAK